MILRLNWFNCLLYSNDFGSDVTGGRMRFQNRIGRACFHLELLFVTLLLLLALVRRSEEGSLFGNEGAPLYGPEDKVFMLNATTIKDHIYGSSRGWVVEFFSSWCGHCISFAPKWKQFALDLARRFAS